MNQSPILQGLQNDQVMSDGASQTHQDKRFAFCVKSIPPLGVAVIGELRKKNYVIPGVKHSQHLYEGTERASWLLIEWPPHDTRKDVETYAVLLLDSGDVVIYTKLWSGTEKLEPYDPYRLVTPALNPQSVYHALASLPHDFYFKKAKMELLPP